MKKLKLLFLLLLPLSAYCQEGVTFKVETLSKPKKALQMLSHKEVYEHLILSDVSLEAGDLHTNSVKLPFNVVTKSEAPDSLVSFGYHSFFYGMYHAYADHRPFTLSPDMIWLLISQGFARHINANPEQFRTQFVNFDGKHSLVVTNSINLESPSKDWERLFPQFTKQIANHAGKELMDLLTANFSTTTPTERIASEITVMKAMETYFEYVYIRIICGIPKITLKGTSEDWQKIIDKTDRLAKFDLEWWTNELKPLLQEFVKASNGQIDQPFWQNMFKYHTQKTYGAPNVIDGWIVTFFPYDKNGKRNNLKELHGANMLPEEIVKVDLNYIDNGDKDLNIPLELWAGFIGLEQNKKDYTLTPKIGWMIRKKDVNEVGLQESIKIHNKNSSGIHIRVKELPEAIFSIQEVTSLTVDFIDKIIIPDRLTEVKIGNLTLSGSIDNAEIDRIKKMFPNTIVTINPRITFK